MRKFWIPLVGVLLLGGCDRSDELPDEMPAARIAPKTQQAEPQTDEDKPTPMAGEAEEEAPSKGVGAAGCASPECEAACRGHEQPECAEAFAAGCFTDAPPQDKGCEKFTQPSVERKAKAMDADGAPALKAGTEDTIDAKATPIGD